MKACFEDTEHVFICCYNTLVAGKTHIHQYALDTQQHLLLLETAGWQKGEPLQSLPESRQRHSAQSAEKQSKQWISSQEVSKVQPYLQGYLQYSVFHPIRLKNAMRI